MDKMRLTGNFSKACIFMLLLSGFSSCLPEPLEVRGLPGAPPQIVVATQIIPNKSLVVLLTRSFGALDAGEESDPEELLKQIAVNDAVVTIKGPLGIDTLEFIENGIYGGIAINFQEGENYELLVSSESLGEVHASSTVQPHVKFQDLEAYLQCNDEQDTLTQINWSILDPEARNWYMLNVQEVGLENLLQNMINPGAYTELLADQDFPEPYYARSFPVVNKGFMEGDTIAVSISSISEAYYHFLKLRMDNRLKFIEFLSEPVNYPSNIEGGKGFFNLHIPDFRFFVLKEPNPEP